MASQVMPLDLASESFAAQTRMEIVNTKIEIDGNVLRIKRTLRIEVEVEEAMTIGEWNGGCLLGHKEVRDGGDA